MDGQHSNSFSHLVSFSIHALAPQANNQGGGTQQVLERRHPLSKASPSEDDSASHTGQRICGTKKALRIELELIRAERVKLCKQLVCAQIRLLGRQSDELLRQFHATKILLARCDKQIESLQTALSNKPDRVLSHNKRQTIQQPQPYSIYALTPQADDQGEDTSISIPGRPLSKACISGEDSINHTKQTMKIPDPPIFTDGEDPTIDQWLFKMRSKFEVDRGRYPTENSKLVYATGRVGGKGQQQLEAYLHFNSLTSFSAVEDLFAQLQLIFPGPYSIEKKFKGLDMGSSAFKDFHREFTRMAPPPPSSSTSHSSPHPTNNDKDKHTPRKSSIAKFIPGIQKR